MPTESEDLERQETAYLIHVGTVNVCRITQVSHRF